MHMTKSILNTTGAGALALCAGFALSTTSASALTVDFETVGGFNETKSFVDDGLNDEDSDPDAVGSFAFTLGNFSISGFRASVTDTPNQARIQTTSFDFSGGAEGEQLIVTTTGGNLTGGASTPLSALNFTFSGTTLNGSVASQGFVEPASGTVATDTLVFSSPDDEPGAFSGVYTDDIAVTAPFDLVTVMTADPSTASGIGTSLSISTISDDSINVIPLPAGGLLLLSALGGLAALRSRRKPA